MKKVLLISFIALLGAMQLQAQQQGECGVGIMDGALIKQRLMDNRQLFTKQEVNDLMTNRVITYVPLTIHNVQNASGDGAHSTAGILGFVCGLNALYLDQDIQFFIHGSIRTLVSTNLDNSSQTFASRFTMSTQKVANTINIYIARSLNYPGGGSLVSFYDPSADYLFFHSPMVSNAAKTEAHEVGHFLTLNHTHYGWESTDAEAQYSGVAAPSLVGGQPTERVTRGAGANCSSSADGFCDTEADYHSGSVIQLPANCAYNPTVLDPTGAGLNPDETNLMSYYDDNCSNNFSNEQKVAMSIDVAARNWVTNTPPSTAAVTGITTVVSPLDGATLGSISNSTVRLEWTPVAGATWYYLEVYGTLVFGIVNTNDVKYKGIITTGNTFYDLATAGLIAGSDYAWRIKALNPLSTCAGITAYSKFEAVTTVTTDIKSLPIDQQMTLKVNSNPIVTPDIPLTIYSAEEVLGSIRIYAMDGKEIRILSNQTISQGDNVVQIPAQNIANGMYVAVLTTDRGSLQQKFVIQR
jgi:hypothetical protein